MQSTIWQRRLGPVLVAAALWAGGLAAAQTPAAAEPTLQQIYATAQAGKLDEAQTMVQQVLLMHPKSARAHYVRAELMARQGKADLARESLATAERLAPGLPFARPDAVQALRSQLGQGGRNTAATASSGAAPATSSTPLPAASPAPSPAMAHSPAPDGTGTWVLALLALGGVMVGGMWLFRRQPPVQPAGGVGYSIPSSAGPAAWGGTASPYGGSPWGAPPASPAGSGLGGRIAGGVATGLAVGAGLMAAEAIARNLGGRDAPAATGNPGGYQPFDPGTNVNTNANMGGTNFGVADGGSWDDGGAGGGDWDT